VFLVSAIIAAHYTHETKLAELSEKSAKKRYGVYVSLLETEKNLDKLELYSGSSTNDLNVETKNFSNNLSEFVLKLQNDYPFPRNQSEAVIIEEILTTSEKWHSVYKNESVNKNDNSKIHSFKNNDFKELKTLLQCFKIGLRDSMNRSDPKFSCIER
jgi:hypothetical protein